MGLIRSIEGALRSLLGVDGSTDAPKHSSKKDRHRKGAGRTLCLPFLACSYVKRTGIDEHKECPSRTPDSAANLHNLDFDLRSLRVLASKSSSSDCGGQSHRGNQRGAIRPKSLVFDDSPVRPPTPPTRPTSPAVSEASLNHLVKLSTQTVDLGSSSLSDRNVSLLYKANNKIPISPKPVSVIKPSGRKSLSHPAGEADSLTKLKGRMTASLDRFHTLEGGLGDDVLKTPFRDSKGGFVPYASGDDYKRTFSVDYPRNGEQKLLKEWQVSCEEFRAQCLKEAHCNRDYKPYRHIVLGRNMHRYNYGGQISSACTEPKALHVLVASMEIASTVAKLRCSATMQPDIYKKVDLNQGKDQNPLIRQICPSAYGSISLVDLKSQIGGHGDSPVNKTSDRQLAFKLSPSTRSRLH